MGNRMTIRKVFLTTVVFAAFLSARCQDTTGLKFVSYDTLQLAFTASKVLAYKTGSVTFLMNYEKGKDLLALQAKDGLLKEIAKQQLDNAQKQIKNSDTAYLDNAVFAKWNWAPFDQLLCALLNSKSCIIRDEQGRTFSTIIRMHGFVWPDKTIQWTGWRYFLPGTFKHFHECTESES